MLAVIRSGFQKMGGLGWVSADFNGDSSVLVVRGKCQRAWELFCEP